MRNQNTGHKKEREQQGFRHRVLLHVPGDVVCCLGADDYELADVYHSDNSENLFPRVIEKHALQTGSFDNVAACRYCVPTAMDIAKVFLRLVLAVAEKIEDYNSSLYFENPQTVLNAYCNA